MEDAKYTFTGTNLLGEEVKPDAPKHADRITMWVKDHEPHQKLPFVVINNELRWPNRAERRKSK